MIRKRKRKKKKKKKQKALLKEAEEEDEMIIIRKSGGRNRKNSKIQNISFKRKKPITSSLPYQPPTKKSKITNIKEDFRSSDPKNQKIHVPDQRDYNDREDDMKTDFFSIKDSKERRMRRKYHTEDFVGSDYQNKLRVSDVIPDKTFRPGSYYDNTVNVSADQWGFSKMKSVLGGRKVGFLNNPVSPTPMGNINDSTNPRTEENEAEQPKSIREMIKSLGIRTSKYKDRTSFLDDQLKQVDEEITSIEKNLQKYEQDKKYLGDQYTFFVKLKKWVFGILHILEHSNSQIIQLRTKYFDLQKEYFLNRFFTRRLNNDNPNVFFHEYLQKSNSIFQSSKKVENSVTSKYSLLDVRKGFEEWKRSYSHSYFDAHIGLCVRRIFGIYVTLELLSLGWDPFTRPLYFNFLFWRELVNYGGEKVNEEDMDGDLLPHLLVRSVLPFIRNTILYVYNPSSTENTKEMQVVVKELGVVICQFDEFRTNVKGLIVDRFEYVVKNIEKFFGNEEGNISGEVKLEILYRILENAISWTYAAEIGSIAVVPIERLKTVVVQSLLKQKLFPLVLKLSGQKFGNDVARKNYCKRKYDQVISVTEYPNSWKQSIHAIAQNIGIK